MALLVLILAIRPTAGAGRDLAQVCTNVSYPMSVM